MTTFGGALFDQHAAMLAASTITPEHARSRGYVSVDTKVRLEGIGITKAGRNIPGLLVPMLDKHGEVWGYQYRPDSPRLNVTSKPVKYETPTRQRNGIDVPPGVGPKLDDPTVPLWVTEGAKKADAAACAGLACVALAGVWSWRGTNINGGKVAVPDWHDIALNGRSVVVAFDSDVMGKRAVRQALDQLARYLASKGAMVRYLHLPDNGDGKTGLDDYLGAGHTLTDLRKLVRPELPKLVANTEPQDAPAPADPLPAYEPIGLDQGHTVFRRWLGPEYDTDALDVVLAAAAVEQLTGDPVWLLLISGSGNAKTETVIALDGIRATVTSTISSAGALLSGTSRQERSSDATGGLLRKLGARGLLVVKDVTSILSMDRNARAEVLAALREVYDGRWSRNVGTDGGRTLEWAGRITLIGAVTTAWDRAHDVVASMGDRFVLVRVDSTTGRHAAGLRAIGNTGSEIQMREELAAAVGGVLAKLELEPEPLDGEETNLLLAAADLVTLARTGVDYDSRGDVIDAHAPEMPTRFAKQLAQIVRGATAIGIPRTDALRLAIRCARDSMPPLRLAIIDDLAANPDSTPTDVRRRLNKPRTTVDRQMQALHMLGIIDMREEDAEYGGRSVTRWHYAIAGGIEPSSIDPNSLPEMLVTAHKTTKKREGDAVAEVYVPTNKSGKGDVNRLPACSTDWATCQNGNCLAFRACVQAVATGAPTGRPSRTDEAVA